MKKEKHIEKESVIKGLKELGKEANLYKQNMEHHKDIEKQFYKFH